MPTMARRAGEHETVVLPGDGVGANERWRVALARIPALRALVDRETTTCAEIASAAGAAGIGLSTMYCLLRRYRQHRMAASIVVDAQGCMTGENRL